MAVHMRHVFPKPQHKTALFWETLLSSGLIQAVYVDNIPGPVSTAPFGAKLFGVTLGRITHDEHHALSRSRSNGKGLSLQAGLLPCFQRWVIGFAVWAYHRFALSLRDVEDLLAARSITVSHQTIRDWVAEFGTPIAAKIRRNRPQPADKWHPGRSCDPDPREEALALACGRWQRIHARNPCAFAPNTNRGP